jgi:hypothetical protein
MTVCRSGAWGAKIVTSAWWVFGTQVCYLDCAVLLATRMDHTALPYSSCTSILLLNSIAGVEVSPDRRVSAHWVLHDIRQEELPAPHAPRDGVRDHVPPG